MRSRLLSSVISYVVMGLLGGFFILPLQAQTPEETFGDLIYGPNRDGDPVQSICGRLNQLPTGSRTSGTQDLIDRCNELASGQSDLALRQVAAEEVTTQGTNSIETSHKNLGARLAALRAGATGIRLGGLAFDNQRLLTPPTLVASLSQYAAATGPAPQIATAFKRLGLFVNGSLSLGDKDATPNESGFDFETYGLTAGIDYRFTNHFVLGVAFNFQSTETDLASTVTTGATDLADGGSVDSRSYSGSLYATYYIGQFYLDGIVTVGWNDYDIRRNIIYNVGTQVRQAPESETDGTQYSFSFGAGYDFTLAGWTFTPLGRITYIRLDIDGYRETIDNDDPGFGWALEFGSQKVESLTSNLGGQVSYAISTGIGVLLPQFRFDWEHQFLDDRRTITARFINDPEREPIRFSTDAPDRNFFNLGVGLSATFRGGFSAFAQYETVLGLEDVTRHTVVVGVRKEL